MSVGRHIRMYGRMCMCIYEYLSAFTVVCKSATIIIKISWPGIEEKDSDGKDANAHVVAV